MKILVLNAGSNSLKFEIVEANGQTTTADEQTRFGSTLLSGSYDNVGKQHAAFTVAGREKTQLEVHDHGHAAELLFSWIEEGNAKNSGISELKDIQRIGHRVVHGADRFSGPEQIDDRVVRAIEDLEELAPLHNASALKVIRACQHKIGRQIPMVAVFDTVFHRTIPQEAALYPLPLDISTRHRIRRYGFHGISHRYLAIRYAQLANRRLNELSIITLHLEGGSSAAAVREGKSVDTSMGFTPLEGLMMGTRSGDIDPAIVTYLMRKENLDPEGMEDFLNKECGLLGVSGISADTRELREHLSENPPDLALTMFCYRVRKYVGAYLAVLGGAEAIVVGGGIGENTPLVRQRIFENFGWCGLILDPGRNNEVVDREGPITTAASSRQVWVIPTREALMVAKDVADLRL